MIIMFEGKVPKDSTQLRLYIISSFRENVMGNLIARMNKVDFMQVLQQIKEYVLVAD